MNINETMRRLETVLSNDRPEPISPRSKSPTLCSRSPVTPRPQIKQAPQTWMSWFTESLGNSTSSKDIYSQSETLRMTRDIDSLQHLSNLLLSIWQLSLEKEDSLTAESGTMSQEDPLFSSSLEEESNFQPVGPGVWAPQVSESNILTWRGKEQVNL